MCRTQIVEETLPALAELKAQGLVRHLGITGLPLDIYRYILDRQRGACWACPAAAVMLWRCHATLALQRKFPHIK